MWGIYRDLMRIIQRMDPEEFFTLLVLAIVLGFLCLRGFGSRSSY